ncbi:unnamed protein product [Arctia plantaginis]|uniref:Cuticle protein n=1 Tax=Arctia plantaginis TaxID=874455 RepID=A0A8S1AEK2_ARCPL|nr:unnamed protein product [Arctia plantaginis]
MYSKVVALCAFVAVAQAGLLASPVHYSPASAVSSQNIVRHDQHQALAAPVAYHAAPVAYHAAPVHYSSAAAVSSQNIVRHDQHQALAAPAALSYHAAPAPVTYHAAPAVAYHAAPALVAHHAAPVIAKHEDFDAHPKYEYNYSVADGHTGDNKSQQESRDEQTNYCNIILNFNLVNGLGKTI